MYNTTNNGAKKFGTFWFNYIEQKKRGKILEGMEQNCIKAVQSNSCYANILCDGIQGGVLSEQYIGDARKLLNEGSQLPGVYSSGSTLPIKGTDVIGNIVGGVIVKIGRSK